MTESSQPRHPDAATDAKILALIVKGQLQASSSISDGVGSTTLLADHPRFSHVLRLARAGSSIGALRSASFWNEREATWKEDLAQSPSYRIFFDLSRQHATGFLLLERGGVARIVAFSSGTAICVSSNLKREQLGALLVRTNKLPQPYVDEAVALSREKKQMMGWALLQLGMLSVAELHEALHLQAQQRVVGALAWSQGSASFHADARAGQLYPLVETPLLELMRQGIWGDRQLEVDKLQALTAPFFERTEPCRLGAELGALNYELHADEKGLLAKVTAGDPPAVIGSFIAAQQPAAQLALLRAVYTFVQLEIIQLQAPESAQPVLSPLDGVPPSAAPVAAPQKETAAAPAAAPAPAPTPQPAARAVNAPSSAALAALSSVLNQPGSAPAKEAQTDSAASTTAEPPPAAPRRENPKIKDARALDEYRLQLQLQEEGRRLLNSKQFAQAAERFEQLVERQEKPVDAFAYLSLATLLNKGFDYKNKALGFAKQAFEIDKNSGLARVAMYRVFDSMDKAGGAAEHRAHAIQIGSASPIFLAELKTLMALGLEKRVIKREGGGFKRSDAVLVAGAVLLVLLFVLSNALFFGRREYAYDGTDWFFYCRRGVLLLGGLIGLMIFTRSSPKVAFIKLGWQGDFLFTVVAVVLGAFVGWLSPVQRVADLPLIVLSLTALHVFAEEVFFRGFVTYVLLKRITDARAAILFSGLIFGAYHLTYYSFWFESLMWPRLYWSLAIAMIAGVPYAWMFHKSKGIIPPLVAHLAVNLVMMLRSLSAL